MSEPKKPPRVPPHGVGQKLVAWDVLFAYLDSLTVPIPEGAPGEPPDGLAVAILLGKVQNNRDKAVMLYRICEQRVAETKRSIGVQTEILRAERNERLRNADGQTADVRRAEAEAGAAHSSAGVAILKARLAAFEGARNSVKATIDTLETAKQSLNSIKQLILGGASPNGDEFARSSRRP